MPDTTPAVNPKTKGLNLLPAGRIPAESAAIWVTAEDVSNLTRLKDPDRAEAILALVGSDGHDVAVQVVAAALPGAK